MNDKLQLLANLILSSALTYTSILLYSKPAPTKFNCPPSIHTNQQLNQTHINLNTNEVTCTYLPLRESKTNRK